MKQLQKKNPPSIREVSRHCGIPVERKFACSSHPLQRTLGNQAVQHLLRSGFLQPLPAIRAVIPPDTIAGEWIIDNPAHRHTPATGRTDAEILGQAFNDICDLTSRNGDRITVNAGPPAPSRMEGCDCLQTIEQDLSSPSPVLSGMPHVRLEEAGWSRTNPGAAPPYVAARHPESEFAWGYWTAGQTRHVKPFWHANEGGRTLAGSRADRMHTRLGGAFRAQSFPDRFQASTGATVNRFSPDQAAVAPGQSVAGQADPRRRVLIHLFHQPHSAGP